MEEINEKRRSRLVIGNIRLKIMQNPSFDDLRQVVALKGLPDEHLQWILDRAEYFEFEDGDILTKKGEPIESLWLMAEGRSKFYLDLNGKQFFYFTFENDESRTILPVSE